MSDNMEGELGCAAGQQPDQPQPPVHGEQGPAQPPVTELKKPDGPEDLGYVTSQFQRSGGYGR